MLPQRPNYLRRARGLCQLLTFVTCATIIMAGQSEGHPLAQPHVKGGKLERPSKERVQKFKAAAERALQQYQMMQFTMPKSQDMAPPKGAKTESQGKEKMGGGVRARSAAPTDKVFSWRPLIAFNTSENQGSCGSCYIFGGVGALEESWAKQNPTKSIAASQQLVLNCVGSCSGGYLSTVMEFLTDKGTTQASSISYTGIPAGCSFNPPLPYKGIAAEFVASDGGMPAEADLKAAILKYGPIGAFIYAGGTFDDWNQQEPALISDDSSGADNGHIILITGWNDNVKAWEIKNSWGPTWGDNGFAYVKKGVRDIGDNAMWIVALP